MLPSIAVCFLANGLNFSDPLVLIPNSSVVKKVRAIRSDATLEPREIRWSPGHARVAGFVSPFVEAADVHRSRKLNVAPANGGSANSRMLKKAVHRAQYASSIGQHPSCYRKKIGPPFRRPVRRFCRSTGRSTRKLFLSARWNLATV